MANELEKPNAIAQMFAPKKWGVAAQKEAAKKMLEELDPLTMPNKLVILFDDSGSMASMNEKGDKSKIEDAKAGIRNFTVQCSPRDTALAVYPLNADPKPLTCNFDLLNLLVSSIPPSGGTPLYGKGIELLNDAAGFSRGIFFSDGEPTDGSGYYSSYEQEDDSMKQSLKEQMIGLAISKKIPLDTIFIGQGNSAGYRLMKEIADRTGGIFVHFKDSASLSQNLKYLAPALRGLLANAEVKAKIERGESI
jgi:hypothetical protein